ncbi:MAG TPA: DUF4349 domain-containing protein, partial [Patescibacteria group bacterium]|nr:DUF4349 domain-containing protein [Patescibacteria group bacterium]
TISYGVRSSIGMMDESFGYGESAGAPGKALAPTVAMMPPTEAGNDAYYRMMPEPQPTAGQNAAETDQKIVKNGYLHLVVDKVAEAAGAVSRLATERGGFVQSSSVSERGDGAYSGEVIVRVPVAKFEEAMAEIKKLANVVKTENTTGQDVTEQYSDLSAQIRNAKAQEETYLEVLKQARSVEDILKVQERLGYIRATIESLEGRLKYLENTTSYSTINVSLEEEAVVRAPTKEFRLGAILRNAVQTLVGAAQELVAGVIYAIIVWGGILLPIGLIAWGVWKLWKRRTLK